MKGHIRQLCYSGLKDCTDYWKVVETIKDGSYATSLSYVEKLCGIIERWDLNQFNYKSTKSDDIWYRVRKSWRDFMSQKSAFNSLENAKKCADENAGYSVFGEDGNQVYFPKSFTPYQVKVRSDDLNIRKGPGIDCEKWGRYTGAGVYLRLWKKRMLLVQPSGDF